MLKKSFSILLCGLLLVQNATLPALAQEEPMTEEASSTPKLNIDLSQVLTYQSNSIKIHLDGAELLKSAVSLLNSYPSYMRTPIREWLIETQNSEQTITSGATISFSFKLPQGVNFDEERPNEETSTLNELCEVIPLTRNSNQAFFGLKIVPNTTYGQLVDAIESFTIGEYTLSIPVIGEKALSSEDIILQGEMDSLYHLSKLGDIVTPVSFKNNSADLNELNFAFEKEEMEDNSVHTISRKVLIKPTLKINEDSSAILTAGSEFSLTGTLDISAIQKDLTAVWEDHYKKYFLKDQQEPSTGDQQEPSTGDQQEPSTGDQQEPSTGDQQEPSTGDQQEPSAGDQQEPSTGDQQEPSTGDQQEPSAGDQQEPSTGDQQEPSAGDQQEPSAGDQQEPSAGDQQEPSAGTKPEVERLETPNKPTGLVDPLEAIQVDSALVHLEAKLSLPSGIDWPTNNKAQLLNYISIEGAAKNYFSPTIKSLDKNELILEFELDKDKFNWNNLQNILTTLEALGSTFEIKVSGFKAPATPDSYTIRGTVSGNFSGKASWVEKVEETEITHQYDISYELKDTNTYTSTLPEDMTQTQVQLTVQNSTVSTPLGESKIEVELNSSELSFSSSETITPDKFDILKEILNKPSQNPNQYTLEILEAQVSSESNGKYKVNLTLNVSLNPKSLIDLVFKNLKKKTNEVAFLSYETSSAGSYEILDCGNEVIIKGITVEEAFDGNGRINSDQIRTILEPQYEVNALNFSSSQTQNSTFSLTDLNQSIAISVTASTPTYIGGGSSKKPNKKPTQSEPEQPTDQPISPAQKKKVLYRLYNTVTGEHFFTTNQEERDALLADEAWGDEGQGWKTPEFSNSPIYRLCNPNNGDHHYTADKNEYDVLQTHGWIGEGIAMYSAQAEDENIILLHRLYNPYAQGAGSHHYTVNELERDELVKQGWTYEGTAWYGLTDSEEN